MEFYDRENQFIYLSERDEHVPSTHIGMYSLLRNPKNKGIFMGENRVEKVRQDTFKGVYKLYRKYGSPDFADFYNRNAEVITQIGMNHFSYNQKLAPVADLIECFIAFEKKNNSNHIYASFGISKQILTSYLESIKNEGKFDKEFFRSLLANPPDESKSRDFIIFGDEKIELTESTTLRIDRNALYRRFCDWCELQGIEESDGLLIALESLLEAYPLENVKENTEYDILTEFDIPLFHKPEKQADKVKKNVVFSGGILALAEKIVQRYNRDANNLTKQVSFDTYINNAVHLMNQTMPLQYRDPELDDEKKQLEEMVRYNNL